MLPMHSIEFTSRDTNRYSRFSDTRQLLDLRHDLRYLELQLLRGKEREGRFLPLN